MVAPLVELQVSKTSEFLLVLSQGKAWNSGRNRCWEHLAVRVSVFGDIDIPTHDSQREDLDVWRLEPLV
jgi:hypothetical protein